MIPRTRINGLPRGASAAEMRRVLLEEGHSRMPVYEGTLDNIVGYVTARDVLAVAWEGDLVLLEDILRPALFVPTSAPAIRVLKDLQRRHMRIAFVVDERPEEAVRKEPDGSALVRGDLPIREANRLLELELPEEEAWSTIAGLVVALSGGIPTSGTRVRSGDVLLEVVNATPRAVREVRIRREARPGASP
jgi:putative hemolysin